MKAAKLFKSDITPVKRGVRGSFLSGSISVRGVMLHVIAALVPVMIWAVDLFGVRVLAVIAASIRVGSMLKVRMSGSTKTGFAPTYMTASAVAI